MQIELLQFFFAGATSILHDSELPTDVGHCADPGCYSRPIRYNATMRQMNALTDLSTECHQFIQVKYIWYFDSFSLNWSLNFLSIFVVRLQLRAVWIEWCHVFLVERQERSGPVFLGRWQRQRPHLSMRHRPKLRRIHYDVQLRFYCTRSTNWCR